MFAAYNNDNSDLSSGDNINTSVSNNFPSFSFVPVQHAPKKVESLDSSSHSSQATLKRTFSKPKSRLKSKQKQSVHIKPYSTFWIDDTPLQITEAYTLDKRKDCLNLSKESFSNEFLARYEKCKDIIGTSSVRAKLSKLRYFLVKNTASDTDKVLSCEIDSTNRMLNMAVTSDPENVKNWFKLVKFQETLFSNPSVDFKGTKPISIINSKLAIIEKALKFLPHNIELKLAQLEERKLRGDSQSDLSMQYENLVFTHPDSIDVWLAWINWNLTTNNFTSAINMFKKCNKRLCELGSGTLLSHSFTGQTDYSSIQLLQFYYIWNAGYTERALSILQSQIEFIFLKPTHVNESSLIKAFKQYWEVSARIGSSQFVSWNKWNFNDLQGSQPSETNNTSSELQLLSHTLPLWRNWLVLERYRSLNDIFSVSSFIDVADDDRSVSWVDIDNMYLSHANNDLILCEFVLGILNVAEIPWFDWDFLLMYTNNLDLHLAHCPYFAEKPTSNNRLINFIVKVLDNLCCGMGQRCEGTADSITPMILYFDVLLFLAHSKYLTFDFIRSKMKQILNLQPSNYKLWTRYICSEIMFGKSFKKSTLKFAKTLQSDSVKDELIEEIVENLLIVCLGLESNTSSCRSIEMAKDLIDFFYPNVSASSLLAGGISKIKMLIAISILPEETLPGFVDRSICDENIAILAVRWLQNSKIHGINAVIKSLLFNCSSSHRLWSCCLLRFGKSLFLHIDRELQVHSTLALFRVAAIAAKPSSEHRVTRILQRALEKYKFPAPGLWQSLLLNRFRSTCSEKSSHDSFFLAVKSVPWHKPLYLMYSQYFPSALESVMQKMLEQGIRCRAPLEEVELLVEISQSK